MGFPGGVCLGVQKGRVAMYLDLFSWLFFGLYHGKSPLNHVWGKIFVIFVSNDLKQKVEATKHSSRTLGLQARERELCVFSGKDMNKNMGFSPSLDTSHPSGIPVISGCFLFRV